jgi:hypothetical protein
LVIAGFFSPFLDGNDDNYQTKWPKLTLCGPFSITHRIRAQQKQYVDFPLQSSRAVAVELTRKRFPPPCLADVFKGSSHQHLPSGAVVQWQNSAIINDCTGGGSIPPSPSTSQMMWSFGPAFSSELRSPASVVHGLKRPCLFGLQVRSLLGVPNSCPSPNAHNSLGTRCLTRLFSSKYVFNLFLWFIIMPATWQLSRARVPVCSVTIKQYN